MKLIYVKTKELIKKRHEQKKKEKEKEKRQNSGFISLSAVDFVDSFLHLDQKTFEKY